MKTLKEIDPVSFTDFKTVLQAQFEIMSKSTLLVTSIEKDILWNDYLDSFPPGTNEIFRERRTYDCQCCRQFIRTCGNVVSIVDNKLVSIWDVQVGGYYQAVADAMSALVKSSQVKDVFLHYEKTVGTDHNHQLLESGGTMKWEHFYLKLPTKAVSSKDSIGSKLSEFKSGKDVFKRGLSEISLDSAETVLELIEQNSVYRGAEHKATVELFVTHKKAFDLLSSNEEKDNYSWVNSVAIGGAARVRNTSIGTLMTDISDGVDLDGAVRSFEAKVAPENYKRPTALITKGMIVKAQKEVEELGIEGSLKRRYAVTEDITINNVLFADRSVKKAMNVFDELVGGVTENPNKFKKVEEVTIQDFIDSILPKASSIEMLLENRHSNNLMSLIAPIDAGSKQIFKWDNNFSWAYSGEVADSMKERVKKAGGNVTGVLRFSIQWNDEGNNNIDFDAHCHEPNGNKIYYGNKGHRHSSSGMLDVDIISPGGKVAVENITWSDERKMDQGEYRFIVHNYSSRTSNGGFTAEVECNGEIHSFAHNVNLKGNQKIDVAIGDFVNGSFKIKKSLPSTQSSREVWGLPTQQFHKVKMVMNSPNHWDGKTTGNKHWFFMLDRCKNDKPARGFFNEFLKEDLKEHRKVFEVLGSKMKTEVSDNQLSGLGFSSTQNNHIFCKVTGSFNRTIKINF